MSTMSDKVKHGRCPDSVRGDERQAVCVCEWESEWLPAPHGVHRYGVRYTDDAWRDHMQAVRDAHLIGSSGWRDAQEVIDADESGRTFDQFVRSLHIGADQ